MKRLDDLEAKRERDAEFTGEKYTSRFKGKFKVPGSNEAVNKNELRWSVFKHKPADEMLLHVQLKVSRPEIGLHKKVNLWILKTNKTSMV